MIFLRNLNLDLESELITKPQRLTDLIIQLRRRWSVKMTQGIVYPKNVNSTHLLTLMLLQTCMQNTKSNIWKNVCSQTFLVTIDFHYFSKYILYSTEDRESHTIWNSMRVSKIILWTIPLNVRLSNLLYSYNWNIVHKSCCWPLILL